MRTLAIFAAVASLAVVSGRAQDSGPLPERSSVSDDADAVFEPIPLMPQFPGMTAPREYPDAERTPGAAEPDAAAEAFRKPSKTAASAEATRVRIRFRVAEIKASTNPKVQEALDQAETAKSDAERRFAFKIYYDRLYAGITKLDGSISALAEERRQQALHRLEQDRIQPSVWDGEHR